MQRLYENHKVLTYPRTDSRYIGKDVAETLKERLKACGVGPYRKIVGKLTLFSRFVSIRVLSMTVRYRIIMPLYRRSSLSSWVHDQR